VCSCYVMVEFRIWFGHNILNNMQLKELFKLVENNCILSVHGVMLC
jgi:hypothetical protein